MAEDNYPGPDSFGPMPEGDALSHGQALIIDNAPKVMTAQKVGVKRDIARIMNEIKIYAAQAGEKWYYSWPVKNRDGTTDTVEGISIKAAENVARLYGNCTVGARAYDEGTHYNIEAFFVDLETGFNLMRPFRQRKSQKTMKTDADRQADIVFQIGVSKATRNVIANALEHFCDFAKEEAKKSLIDRIGKNLSKSREVLKDRLQDMAIDAKRVERYVGRSIDQMLAPDIARVVASLQAINEGMASVDQIWPLEQQGEDEQKGSGLDQFNQPRSEQKQEAQNEERAPTADASAPKAAESAKPAESAAQPAQSDAASAPQQQTQQPVQPAQQAAPDQQQAAVGAATSKRRGRPTKEEAAAKKAAAEANQAPPPPPPPPPPPLPPPPTVGQLAEQVAGQPAFSLCDLSEEVPDEETGELSYMIYDYDSDSEFPAQAEAMLKACYQKRGIQGVEEFMADDINKETFAAMPPSMTAPLIGMVDRWRKNVDVPAIPAFLKREAPPPADPNKTDFFTE